MGIVLAEKINIDDTLYHLERDRCALDLAYFIRKAWKHLEPDQPYCEGWHIRLICQHLEAITDAVEKVDGTPYNRLLINVPPGMMKSLLVNVFWPAWEWGPRNKPSTRYLMVSHSLANPVRDAGKLRRLIVSDWYQERWPINFRDDQNAKTYYENTKTGFVAAVATGSITGKRGDRVLLDDAMSWEDANSDTIRAARIAWFRGALTSRLNSTVRSAVVVIEQRLHQEDISGVILDGDFGYDHIKLPMEYDEANPMFPTMLGVLDPRSTPGELLFPEMFPAIQLGRDKKIMNPYEIAGQYQQVPVPKGGGMINREWWRLWSAEQFPDLDYIVASVDTAYGEKQENDYSAMTVFGVFTASDKAVAATRGVDRYGRAQEYERAYQDSAPQVILLNAWRARLPFHDLAKRVLETARKFKIDRLLIEEKAAGKSIVQELRRVIGAEEFGLQSQFSNDTNPQLNKWTRLNAISYLWCDGKDPNGKWIPGIVWAPDREWAEMVMQEVEVFPKGKHDDLVDCVSMAVKYLRDNGFLSRAPERLQEIADSMVFHGSQPTALYPG